MTTRYITVTLGPRAADGYHPTSQHASMAMNNVTLQYDDTVITSLGAMRACLNEVWAQAQANAALTK